MPKLGYDTAMADKDLEWFDPGSVPPRYPFIHPGETGLWRVVHDRKEGAVGVVWTNEEDAAGVLWVTQTKPIARLHQHFLDGAAAGTPALAAYSNAENVSGVRLSPQMSGNLQGVRDAIDDMIADINERDGL